MWASSGWSGQGGRVRCGGAVCLAALHGVGDPQTLAVWAPVISAARSSGARNDGGGGGPQA